MPAIEKLSIALPTEVASVVQQAVDTGEYSSQSEVVRDALLEWSHQRELRAQGLGELRQAWQEAVADESDGEDPAPILDAFERKYDALAKVSGQ